MRKLASRRWKLWNENVTPELHGSNFLKPPQKKVYFCNSGAIRWENFLPFIDACVAWFSDEDVVDRGVDVVCRWFSVWFPPELNWCWWWWLRWTPALFVWNWLNDEDVDEFIGSVPFIMPTPPLLLLLLFVAKPLICSDSAMLMNDWSSACFTFTSPWYINCNSSDMMEYVTSFSITWIMNKWRHVRSHE